MEAIARNIQAYLTDHRAEMEQLLTDLALLETPSRDPGSQENIFDKLATEYAKIGYRSIRVPGKTTGGSMLFRPVTRQKHRPIQLMIGHCDTVWKKGTLESMPVQVSDEKIEGPGTFDMKAGLTQMIFAIRAIRELGLAYDVTPVCFINSDEEIGSRESTRMIKRLARIADRAYVLEPPLGMEGHLKTARKGLGRFTITIKGKAAHAGLDPGKGASAILELSHQVQNLFALNDLERGITVNVGMIEGGVSPNVVAPMTKAVVDVRVPTMADAEEIEKKINELTAVDPNVELLIEGHFGRPPMERTERNTILWQQAQDAARHLDIRLDQATAGGGSDANTTSLYTATLDGLGTTGDGAHALHEHIIREAFVERTALLTLLLLIPPLKD